MPSETVQETMIEILYYLVKLHTIEKRKIDEVEKGFTWDNIKCANCGHPHRIRVHAVKRRTTSRRNIFGEKKYYDWFLEHPKRIKK